MINLDPKKTTTQPMGGMTPSDSGMSSGAVADDQTAAMGGTSTSAQMPADPTATAEPMMPSTPTASADDMGATAGLGSTMPGASMEPTEVPVVIDPMANEPGMPGQPPVTTPGTPAVKGAGTGDSTSGTGSSA